MGAGQEGLFRIVIARTHQPLATRASFASTFRQRLMGLLGRSALDEEEALVFTHCRSIHTMGMRCAIDVVVVDSAWRVVAVHPEVAPGRVVWPAPRGWGAVEMAAGAAQRRGVVVGDELSVVPVSFSVPPTC